MAGRGPAPALPNEKRRADTQNFQELPAEGYQGEFPPLPATYNVSVWNADKKKHVTTRTRFLPETRNWYEAWARSPMATEFTGVHWLRLQTMAKLQDRFDRGDMTVAAELRQGLANFGGTPMDVRRLGRTIARQPDDAGGTPRARPAASSRRARLELVPE